MVPSEQEMRDNVLKVFTVRKTNIWFDNIDGIGMFFAAPASTGDAGDRFDHYEEMIKSIE